MPKIYPGTPCTYCTKERLAKGLPVRMATQIHHQFSQTEANRNLYGQKLLDDPRNAKPACAHCNVSHAGPVVIWNEFEFCEALGIKPRSKDAKAREQREREYNAKDHDNNG